MKNGDKAVHTIALTKLIVQSVSNYILIKRLEYIISNQAVWCLILLVMKIIIGD